MSFGQILDQRDYLVDKYKSLKREEKQLITKLNAISKEDNMTLQLTQDLFQVRTELNKFK